MKKIIAVLLVSVFTLSHGLCSDMLTRFATVSISSNGHLWYNVPIDLSTAVYNPQTGQREIHMEVEVPAGESMQFSRLSSGYIANVYWFDPVPDCIGCIIL